MRRSLRTIAVGTAAVLASLAMATAALAVSPHFVSFSAALSGTDLDVSWKEAGLGNNTTINYRVSADATATYVCVNRGGGNPSASNKTNVSGPVDAFDTATSGKNGNITDSVTLSPPPPPSTFSCPPGQKEQIAEVVYTDVVIYDLTTPLDQPVSGTFDTGCLLPNVRGACTP